MQMHSVDLRLYLRQDSNPKPVVQQAKTLITKLWKPLRVAVTIFIRMKVAKVCLNFDIITR